MYKYQAIAGEIRAVYLMIPDTVCSVYESIWNKVGDSHERKTLRKLGAFSDASQASSVE